VFQKYHVIYSVRYYPRFHVTAVILGRFTREYGGPLVYTSIEAYIHMQIHVHPESNKKNGEVGEYPQ